MRRIAVTLALLAGLGLAAAAAPAQTTKVKARATTKTAPAPARDWRTHVAQSPSGAFIIGNPAAKVRLVEYLSYTCGHCAQFVADSTAPLHDDLVRRGVVRIEVRHAVRDPLDMAATLLVRCAGPRAFSGASRAIFAAQRTWFNQGRQWWQVNGAPLQSQPEIVQLRGIAEGSGLNQMLRERGVTQAAIDQCFASDADLNRVTAMTAAAWKTIEGTPTFLINGKAGGGGAWSTLEPELRAAGAR